MFEHILEGVHPEPLASYLKAVAVLRLVAEQVDPDASLAWHHDVARLRTTLDRDALLNFFVDEWSPTPLLAPWNGGAGFRAGESLSATAEILADTSSRFQPYRDAISAARQIVADVGDVDKATLLNTLRANMPDEALKWIDAAVVLGGDDPSFPPLVGTGGNDGRFEFSRNQMDRLVTLLLAPTYAVTSRSQLMAALFGGTTTLERNPIGQFAPSRAGGANTGFGFDADAMINPWDYVFALEGAVMFAASTSRALEATADVAFPFYVRSTAAGFGSASTVEKNRGELWMPLWERFVTAGELEALIGEGRAWLEKRPARTADEFSRAIRQLGVTRGIESFQRYVIAERNGLAYFATSAGRYRVASEPVIDPLTAIDPWLSQVRRAAESETAPARLRDAHRRLMKAVMRKTDSADDEEQLLFAVGALSAAVARSRKHSVLEFVGPMPRLSRGAWPALRKSGGAEWEIAFALAGAGLRNELQPVEIVPYPKWRELVRESDVSDSVPVFRRLAEVVARRIRSDNGVFARRGESTVEMHAVMELVTGNLDGVRLASALEGAMVSTATVHGRATDVRPSLPVALAFVALYGSRGKVNVDFRKSAGDEGEWPFPHTMIELLLRGRASKAIAEARSHLLSHGVNCEWPVPPLSDAVAQRLAIALMLPITNAALAAARSRVGVRRVDGSSEG